MLTNKQRIARCIRAITGYSGDSDLTASLVDLLTDAMHFCRSHSLEFGRLLASARMHFEAEESEAAKCSDIDAAHDRLSDLLEDPDAGNDEVREAAIDLCAVLTGRNQVRAAAPAKPKGVRS
jgi:hypothetical protein